MPNTPSPHSLIHITVRFSAGELQLAREIADQFGVPLSVAIRTAFLAGAERIGETVQHEERIRGATSR